MPILQEEKKDNPLRVVTNLLRTPFLFFFTALSLSLNHAFPMRSKTCKHKQTQVATENPPKKIHTHTQTKTNSSASVCLTNQQETTCA
jgi:hypothetical protein